MGADKALLQFRGRPLIVHSIGILREAGLPVSIAGARSDLGDYASVINDLDSGRGPLSGICSAMAVTSVPWLVFMPVDLPLLPPALINALLDHAEITGHPITLTSAAGFTQTFPAVLNRTVLPFLRSKLESGPYGCFSAFQAAGAALNEQPSVLPAELLSQTGQVRHPDGLPPACWFSNLNSPADLGRLEARRPIRNAGPS